MKPGPRTGPIIGRTEQARLKQMEYKMGSDNKEKQSTTLDTKRKLLPEVAVVASISQEEDTIKQPFTIWQEDLEEEKEKGNKIDEIIESASSENEWNVDEVILTNLTSSIEEKGKLKNLYQAIELLNGTGNINNFQEYIKDELEADKFFQRVLNRVSSSQLSNTASSQMSINLYDEQIFKSVKSGKSYENREQTSFFDNLFRFTLNKDCYIIYEKREDNSLYIDMIRCAPRIDLPENRSVKGSGRVMIYDWLLFLTQTINEIKSKYNDSTRICLTPEPSVGREEHTDPKKLRNYYSEMGFNRNTETRYWCGTIGDIKTKIDILLNTIAKEGTPKYLLIKSSVIAEKPGGYGGRRKRTKKKRTRRKTRKSRKSRRRR